MKTGALIVMVAVIAGTAGFLVYHYTQSPTTTAETASAPTQPPAKTIATTLPDFSLPNRAGEKQSIRSWPGKSMIVNFWATWCGPCRKEIPLLVDVAKGTAGDGFQVVGVAIDYRDDVLKYANEMKIDYPILIGEQDGLAAADSFGVDSAGLPFTAFSDNKGRIVMIWMGELTLPKIDLILGNVKRVNNGELTPEAARAEIASKVQGMTAG